MQHKTTARDTAIDNAKLILILLVVLGHCIEGIASVSTSVSYVCRFIDVFHIPAFVFFAGLVSKSTPIRAQFGLLRLLFLFQIVYVALLGPPDYAWYSRPFVHLWFLLSLFCWRASLPYLLCLPYPLLLSLFLALGCGMLPVIGLDFSLSHTLVFLPFFLAGHLYGKPLLHWSANRYWFLLLCCIVCIALTPLVFTNPHWLNASYGYGVLGVSALRGSAFRLLQLLCASAGIIAFVMLLPRPDLWAGRGQHVLSVYLLHGFWVFPLRFILPAIAHFSIPLALIVAVGTTGALAWALTNEKLSRAIGYLYKNSWRACAEHLRRKSYRSL